VFFRDSTRRVALTLELSGHAVNLADGSVEVVARGSATALESLRRWLAQGPDMARVDSVACETIDPPFLNGFTIG